MMRTTPKIIELVGPAGAGKSTLARALEQRSENVARRFIPYYRDPRQLPFFARNTLAMLPTFAQLLSHQNGKRLQRQEVARMVILNGWHQVLQRPDPEGKDVFLIDQGAISILTVTRVTGSGVLSGSGGDWWQSKMCKQWANTLDMVIWLDAPNAILVSRVRARPQRHSIKQRSDPMAFKLLDDFREAYEQMFLDLLTERKDLRILRFDTAQESLDQLCDQVSTVLGLIPREPSNGDH